jgi:hypothetical protein
MVESSKNIFAIFIFPSVLNHHTDVVTSLLCGGFAKNWLPNIALDCWAVEFLLRTSKRNIDFKYVFARQTN